MDHIGKKKVFFRDYLTNQGLKSTKQREAIADIFFETDEHLSLAELHNRLKEKHPEIGFATVYRTIKLFEKCGLAAPRYFGNMEARYEQEFGVEHHDHLICTRCGKIVEFHNDDIEALQDKIAKRHRFKLLHHRHELYGICDKCPPQQEEILRASVSQDNLRR